MAPGISTSTRAARALTLLQSILAGQSWGHRAPARDALAKARQQQQEVHGEDLTAAFPLLATLCLICWH